MSAAIAAVTVLALVALAYTLQRGPSASRPATARAAVLPAGAVLGAPDHPASRVASRPLLAHDRVAPAPPTTFEIKGPAFDIHATVCQMAYVRPLDPPGDQVHTVCWVKQGFGVAPGSKSRGTSYILGHSWSQQQLVFNPLSELATRQMDVRHPVLQGGVAIYPVPGIDGYRVTLRTGNGTLAYVVRQSFAVSKEQAGNLHSLMANTPDRVVLITCAVGGGADLDYNIVVYADLVSSRAT